MKTKKITRYCEEYNQLKNEYFDWLENTSDPLNLCDWAYMYKNIIILGGK